MSPVISIRNSYDTCVVCEFLFEFLISIYAGSVDDEYRWAGVEDPKIMITTARDPSSKLKQFAKVSLTL